MEKLFPKERGQLARGLKNARAVDRMTVQPTHQWHYKRDRSADWYLRYLEGFQASFDYIRDLSNKSIIDLGAGTSRACAEILKTRFGTGLSILGTGINFDPAVAKHLGHDNFRITPAEIMRGFKPASIGGVISVFGPFMHSAFPEMVLKRTDELLIPGGLLKFCIMKDVPGSKLNDDHALRILQIQGMLMELGYGLDMHDTEIGKERIGTHTIFLAIKPDSGLERINAMARRIAEVDCRTLEQSRASLKADLLTV